MWCFPCHLLCPGVSFKFCLSSKLYQWMNGFGVGLLLLFLHTFTKEVFWIDWFSTRKDFYTTFLWVCVCVSVSVPCSRQQRRRLTCVDARKHYPLRFGEKCGGANNRKLHNIYFTCKSSFIARSCGERESETIGRKLASRSVSDEKHARYLRLP